MKIEGSPFSFNRPLNTFGRANVSLFTPSQAFGTRNTFQPAGGPSVWSAIQRIQTILLERQEQSASNTGGTNIYAEKKSVTGGNVSGATIGGKFLDVKSVSMQYVDSDATDTRFTAKTILASSFDGDRTAVTADRIENSQINGDKSIVNVKTLTGGQIGGDGVTINAEDINGVLQIKGSGATINAENIAFAQVGGQGAKLKAETLGVLTVTANSVSLEATKAGSLSLAGGDNTVKLGTATTVRGGSCKDRIEVGTAAYVAGGKGDDTLVLGSGVREVRFNAGDGKDTIEAEKGTRIAFGAGIRRDDVIVARDGDTYRLTFRNSTDQITLKTGAGASSKLTFADGSTLDL